MNFYRNSVTASLIAIAFSCSFSIPAIAIDRSNTEHWTQFESHHFNLLNSLFRSQGVATDGAGNWWYSSQLSLLRTTSKWGKQRAFKLKPFPYKLFQNGDNHIGSIDVAGNELFAPVEDGPKYQHPYILVYDAHSLNLLRYGSLPQPLQHDGVPWVAADAANNRVYSSQYYGTTKINVYDMQSLKLLGQIGMSMKIDAIQGAKVFGDSLYMVANAQPDREHPQAGASKYSVYKMNLQSGAVSVVINLPANFVEVESLTFDHDGALYVLGVIPVNGGVAHKLHIRRTELCGYRLDAGAVTAER